MKIVVRSNNDRSAGLSSSLPSVVSIYIMIVKERDCVELVEFGSRLGRVLYACS